MEPAPINIDGHVDLIHQAPAVDQPGTEIDRVRASRLNDVMIVLEREKAAFEASLLARLSNDVLKGGIQRVTLNLDDQAPKFSVAVEPSTEDGAVPELGAEQRAALAASTASELLATIEKHASYSDRPRWKPSVEAVYRPAATEAEREKRLKSIWLRTLFWLLAVIILGAAYLYLKREPV